MYPLSIETELNALRTKTDRQLRLRELLIDHSVESNLVVMYVIFIIICHKENKKFIT